MVRTRAALNRSYVRVCFGVVCNLDEGGVWVEGAVPTGTISTARDLQHDPHLRAERRTAGRLNAQRG